MLRRKTSTVLKIGKKRLRANGYYLNLKEFPFLILFLIAFGSFEQCATSSQNFQIFSFSKRCCVSFQNLRLNIRVFKSFNFLNFQIFISSTLLNYDISTFQTFKYLTLDKRTKQIWNKSHRHLKCLKSFKL